MRRDQLEHAIRTACQIIERRAVVVIGSQAILGTFTEDQLPPEATMSVEVDILPIGDDNDETTRLADLIEGVAGEWSPFEEQHGFSIDGADHTTASCPTAGATAWSRSPTPTPPRPADDPATPAGAWTPKTSASRSSAPSARRTRTSSPPSSTPDSSTPTSSRPASPRLPDEHRPDAERGLTWLAARS